MASRKRNEWLDAEQSEDEDVGYDSEAEEERSKGRTLNRRALKRRKLDGEDSDEGDDNEEDAAVTDEEDNNDRIGKLAASSKTDVKRTQATDETDEATEREEATERDEAIEHDDQDERAAAKPKRTLKGLTTKSLERSQRAASKTGVVYISRIPPFMKPSTLRNLLAPHGAVGRVFLTPEDPAAHAARVRAGGNRKRSFVDGWAEFASKRDARAAAEALNARTVGGRAGGWYRDDVWSVRYLRGFKWRHLTEQIANENAERAARMRAEIAQTTRENRLFLANVERAKMLEGMESKRKKRLKASGAAHDAAAAKSIDDGVEKAGHVRHFKQNKALPKSTKKQDTQESEDVKRVLSKIF